MRHFVSLTIALLGSVMAFTQVNLPYTENFDALNGWDNNTTNENWIIYDSTAYLNSFDASGFISFQSPSFNTTTVNNPALQFDVKINATGGCKPELKFRTSINGGASYTIYEISVNGQSCSSADISIPNNTWRTIELYNLPQINNYLISLSADFFGGSGSIRVDNIELNTRDSLSINLPEPPDTTTTALINIPIKSNNLYYYNGFVKSSNNTTFENIRVIDLIGNIVLKVPGMQNHIDCSSLPSGVYFLSAFNLQLGIPVSLQFIKPK